MMYRRWMRREKITARLLAALLAAMLSIPLGAQSTTELHPFSYDVQSEVTLQGTTSSVLQKPAPGMVFGAHVWLTTASGAVDVSLGRFGLRGKGAVPVEAGKQMEVTGVMKTIKDHQVFLARTVKVEGGIYQIRNEHGIEISPQARPGAIEKSEQKGNSL
jgi:hypothetical protein